MTRPAARLARRIPFAVRLRTRRPLLEELRPGYRLDHVIASPEVAVEGCGYLHEWRESGLSDHSGMWARIVLRPPG